MASAMPVSSSVTEVLVITEEPRGMRARTAARAPSRSSTTSTLNPCSSSATTVAVRVASSGSAVKRSDDWVVVMIWFSFGDISVSGPGSCAGSSWGVSWDRDVHVHRGGIGFPRDLALRRKWWLWTDCHRWNQSTYGPLKTGASPYGLPAM